MDHLRLWEEGAFIAVALIQKAASLAYYWAVMSTTLKFGEMRWYLKGPWVRQYQQVRRPGEAGLP